MQLPQIRPGKVPETRDQAPTLIVLFRNAAAANATIQLVVQLGVPSDKLGVTPPDAMPGQQGMLLSIPCPDDELRDQIEKICRAQGAVVHGQRL